MDRAALFYPGSRQGAPAEKPGKVPSSNAERGKVMYGARTPGGGSYDLAAANYYDRVEGKLRNDKEQLAEMRRERGRTVEWARKYNITPHALNEALNVVLEKQAHNKSPLSLEQERERSEATREALRLELGSSEARDAMLQNYVQLTATLAAENPSLAVRANITGAGLDIRMVRALAPFGAQIPPK